VACNELYAVDWQLMLPNFDFGFNRRVQYQYRITRHSAIELLRDCAAFGALLHHLRLEGVCSGRRVFMAVCEGAHTHSMEVVADSLHVHVSFKHRVCRGCRSKHNLPLDRRGDEGAL